MQTKSNSQLSLTDLFKKRDYMKELINLGYDLNHEHQNVEIAIIQRVGEIHERTPNC